MLCLRNVVFFCLFCVFVATLVYPFLKYVLITFDKHYFGYFVERVPRLALTTAQKNYFESQGIPFHTIQDRKKQTEMYHIRQKLGEPHPWELEYQNQTGFLHDFKVAATEIHRRLQIAKPPSQRQLQDVLLERDQDEDKRNENYFTNVTTIAKEEIERVVKNELELNMSRPNVTASKTLLSYEASYYEIFSRDTLARGGFLIYLFGK